jgi:hypothetical protein
VTAITAGQRAVLESLRIDGGMARRRTSKWRPIMNTKETSQIRELTTVELDVVSGGELPTVGEAVKWVVKKTTGVDLDEVADTAKDVGKALWKPIQLPF